MTRIYRAALIILSLCLFVSCTDKKSLLTLMDPAETGIDFVNSVAESEQMNILPYEYFYNGGVGRNNDSLKIFKVIEHEKKNTMQ